MIPKKLFLSLGLLAVSILLMFTHFYGIGYILLAVALALHLPDSKVFESLFSRVVLSILILLSSIMISGLLTWYIETALTPIVVLTTFSIVALLIVWTSKSKATMPLPIFKKSDALGLLLGLALPAVIYVSYFFPTYSNAALYQLVSNGWDHSSHVAMVEDAAVKKGYSYGPESKTNTTIGAPSAYPQAWHLATANFANGFGAANVFNPENPLKALRGYAIAVAAWFVLGAFILTLVTLSIWRKLRTKTALPKTLEVASFVTVSLFIQLLTIGGSLLVGFANFLGLMVYLLIFIAALLDSKEKQYSSHNVLLAAIACTSGIMCWFLPLPAFITALALLVFYMKDSTPLPLFLKQNALSLLASLAILVAAFAQVAIFIKFSHISGSEQLTVDGGVFKNSELLIAVMAIVPAIYLYKRAAMDLFKKFIIVVAPFLAVTFAIYVYQMAFSSEESYYFFKLANILSLCLVVFFLPVTLVGISAAYQRLHTGKLLSIVLIIAAGCLLILGTHQSLDALYNIPQRNSKVTYTTAAKIVEYLQRENPEKVKLLVFTDRSKEPGPPRNENYNGDLATKLSNLPYTCVFRVFNVQERSASQSSKARLERLDACATASRGEFVIEVITNRRMLPKIEALHNSNIRIVLVD